MRKMLNMSRAARALMVVVILTEMSAAFAAWQHMLRPRVPSDQLDEARALTSPLPDSPGK